MRTLSTMQLSAPPAAAPRARRRRARGTLSRIAVAVAGFTLLAMPEQPESAIGGDLASAAKALQKLPANAAPDTVRQTLQSSFPGRAVSVDAGGFPVAVAVTLHGLDRAACVSAELSARRLEGRVVVELLNYESPAACAGANDMTWRFMP